MYRSPEALEKMVQEKKKMQNLDEWQAIEKTEHPDAFAYPDFVETPEFSPSSNQKGEGQKRSTTNFSILPRATGALRRSTLLSAARRRQQSRRPPGLGAPLGSVKRTILGTPRGMMQKQKQRTSSILSVRAVCWDAWVVFARKKPAGRTHTGRAGNPGTRMRCIH